MVLGNPPKRAGSGGGRRWKERIRLCVCVCMCDYVKEAGPETMLDELAPLVFCPAWFFALHVRPDP